MKSKQNCVFTNAIKREICTLKAGNFIKGKRSKHIAVSDDSTGHCERIEDFMTGSRKLGETIPPTSVKHKRNQLGMLRLRKPPQHQCQS